MKVPVANCVILSFLFRLFYGVGRFRDCSLVVRAWTIQPKNIDLWHMSTFQLVVLGFTTRPSLAYYLGYKFGTNTEGWRQVDKPVVKTLSILLWSFLILRSQPILVGEGLGDYNDVETMMMILHRCSSSFNFLFHDHLFLPYAFATCILPSV